MNKQNADLKVLVIGLGSMGKRRIRSLFALGITKIMGFDIREDRREEVFNNYHVPVTDVFDKVCNDSDVWIISVPPDKHHIYMKLAIKNKKPAFIEASVVDTDLEEIIKEAKESNVMLAPSCTMWYHPAIQKIAAILESKELGALSFLQYHSGQYLPDWHSYESVADFYVSKKETGGAREIVPFETTWITKILGFPRKIVGMHKKTVDIEGAEEIDDTYTALLDYGSFILNLTVDVVSRCATRRLLINGERKQLYWDWDNNDIRIYDPETTRWEISDYKISEAQEGYNKNITEQIYIDEINDFLKAALGYKIFPNTLENDYRVLKLLYMIEESNSTEKFLSF